MILGFHAGSLLLHDESSVCQELSSLGFTAVAIRPRLGALDPSSKRITEQCMRLGAVAKQHGSSTQKVDTSLTHDDHDGHHLQVGIAAKPTNALS